MTRTDAEMRGVGHRGIVSGTPSFTGFSRRGRARYPSAYTHCSAMPQGPGQRRAREMRTSVDPQSCSRSSLGCSLNNGGRIWLPVEGAGSSSLPGPQTSMSDTSRKVVVRDVAGRGEAGPHPTRSCGASPGSPLTALSPGAEVPEEARAAVRAQPAEAWAGEGMLARWGSEAGSGWSEGADSGRVSADSRRSMAVSSGVPGAAW